MFSASCQTVEEGGNSSWSHLKMNQKAHLRKFSKLFCRKLTNNFIYNAYWVFVLIHVYSNVNENLLAASYRSEFWGPKLWLRSSRHEWRTSRLWPWCIPFTTEDSLRTIHCPQEQDEDHVFESWWQLLQERPCWPGMTESLSFNLSLSLFYILSHSLYFVSNFLEEH